VHLPASNIHCYYITSFPYFTLYKGDYFTYLRLRVKEKHQRGNYNMQNFHTPLLYVHVQVLFKQKQSCVTTIKQMPAQPHIGIHATLTLLSVCWGRWASCDVMLVSNALENKETLLKFHTASVCRGVTVVWVVTNFVNEFASWRSTALISKWGNLRPII